MTGVLSEISNVLARNGLICRGRFAFEADDQPPSVESQKPGCAIVLVGQRGAEPWPHFQRWLANNSTQVSNPLDTWSREIIASVAVRFGARAVSPSDRPYLPFQQWAMRAEGLKSSPLGILMHPQYGLWHAYRGALIFGEGDVAEEVRALNQSPANPIHLCDLCIGKPCQKACPVDAHAGDGFDYQGCLSHVRSPHGEPCQTAGCLDRNACPYGVEWRYPADVQSFHMAAFASLATHSDQ